MLQTALTDLQRYRHGHSGANRWGNDYCRGIRSSRHTGDIDAEGEGCSLSGSVTAGGRGDRQPCLGGRARCPCQGIATCVLYVDGLRGGVRANGGGVCHAVGPSSIWGGGMLMVTVTVDG